MLDTQAILADLNPPQREAVETLSGPLLILAGAGSGKTRVVTRRIANLIMHGVRPWEILAITFTNKAAGEMRRRVEDLAGGGSGVWLSTFHSFCARILRREARVLGLSPDYTIYDEDDANRVLSDVVKELGLHDKRYSPANLRGRISRLKSRGLGPEDLPSATFQQRIVQQAYQHYAETLARNQALDFDDLLLKATALLRDHAGVRERYARRFRHLLVDEYQDTNGCQYELIKLLGQVHRNVCVTGDPDQSIYAWRGADVRNILSFEKDFPEAKVVRLEQNYRSTKRILAAASAVIKNNVERKEKRLWTDKAEGDSPRLTIVGDQELEAYEAAKEIKDLLHSGRQPSEIAIFYRTNAQSRPFESALIQAAIPYRLVGGTPFYERREVKDALAYLRLLVNPKDDVSFRRAVNAPRRGVGDAAVNMVARHATEAGCSMLESLDEPHWIEQNVKGKAREGLAAFARLLDGLRKLPPRPVRDVVVRAIEDSGLRKALQDADESERLDNLEQLVNAAAVYDHENEAAAALPAEPPPEPGAYDGLEELAQRQASVAGFLENAALVQPTDGLDDSARVTLMTLHMAKGLEFPFVFITGLEEGLLPLLRANSDDEAQDQRGEDRAIEEERRLFYVGMTRARERLFLSRAERRMRYGKTDFTAPSRFIEEIPERNLEVVERSESDWAAGTGFDTGRRARQRERRDFDPFGDPEPRWRERPHGERRAKAYVETVPDEAPEPLVGKVLGGLALDVSESQLDDAGFTVGDHVLHDTFGEGTIESFSGAGLGRKARIHFKRAGPKTLLLNMAHLRRKV